MGTELQLFVLERRKGAFDGDLWGGIRSRGQPGNCGVLDQCSLGSWARSQYFPFFNIHMNHHLVKIEILIQLISGGTWDSTFLTNSQVTSMLLSHTMNSWAPGHRQQRKVNIDSFLLRKRKQNQWLWRKTCQDLQLRWYSFSRNI